jgi:hypothetical protein
MAQAQSDVQHLWFGRRASTRMRSELMTAIYDKALKRKDFSGIVNKKETAPKTDKEKAKADDPKAGADVGKIVNLMAVDANRCAMMISGLYFIYGAPFGESCGTRGPSIAKRLLDIEIIIASTFLYQ